MGNENNDPIVLQSSIALLQERFRQLQRVKAMREEKELSKNVFVESTKKLSPTMQYYHEPAAAANRLFFNPELILQPKSPPHICLSLWPNPQSKHAGFRCDQAIPPVLMKTPASKHGLLDKFDDPSTDDDDDDDIDTSLHL